MKKWLREPLLHFILIGGAIFFLYGLLNDEVVVDDGNRIVITGADVDRLITLWEQKWQRLPTQIELEGLVEAQIHEEVLYREAMAMGLDQDDTIVRRRLAQKVEFISSELTSPAEPTEADLADYLAAHAEKFEVPGRISFVQIYLNTDRRGEHAQDDALLLLDQLRKPALHVDIMTAGDTFMLDQQHEQLTEHGVARLFGKTFASKLFALEAGGWKGPIASGYGLHLVRIGSKTNSSQPNLDAVRDRVRDEWLFQQRRAGDEVFYNELRKRYEITVEFADSRSQKLNGPATK